MDSVEVVQGLTGVERVKILHDTDDFVVYHVVTAVKRPQVISWNSNTVTLLPADVQWPDVKPADYAVVKFPERRGFLGMYQEESYGVYFVQFRDETGTDIWPA